MESAKIQDDLQQEGDQDDRQQGEENQPACPVQIDDGRICSEKLRRRCGVKRHINFLNPSIISCTKRDSPLWCITAPVEAVPLGFQFPVLSSQFPVISIQYSVFSIQ